jgi:hypothetical protein
LKLARTFCMTARTRASVIVVVLLAVDVAV